MQSNGTKIYFIIYATDNEDGNKQSSEYEYTVNKLPVVSDISSTPENPTDNDAVTISATITDIDGSIYSADVK
jgi:hypothetical protein